LLLISFYIIGFFSFSTYIKIPEGSIILTGKIERISNKQLLLKDVRYLDENCWVKTNVKTYVNVNDSSKMIRSDWIFVSGESNNFKGISFIKPKFYRGYFSYKYLPSLFDHLVSYGNKISNSFYSYISDLIGEHNGEIAASMLLGRVPTKNLKNKINLSGISHIFVVSGLHFYIVFFFVDALSSFFKNNLLKNITCFFFILSFIFITGFTPSSMRAFFLISSFLLFNSVHYKISRFNLLAFCGLIMLLFKPDYIYDVGFQLSFSATFGLMLFNRYTLLSDKKILKIMPVIGAIICSIPFVIFHFERIPFLSIPLNLFIISILSWVMIMPLVVSLYTYIFGLKLISEFLIMGLKPLLILSNSLIDFLALFAGTVQISKWNAVIISIMILLFILLLENKRKQIHE